MFGRILAVSALAASVFGAGSLMDARAQSMPNGYGLGMPAAPAPAPQAAPQQGRNFQQPGRNSGFNENTTGSGMSTRMSDSPSTRMTPENGRPLNGGRSDFDRPGVNRPEGQNRDRGPDRDLDRDRRGENDNRRYQPGGYSSNTVIVVTPDGIMPTTTLDERGALCDRRWDELERNRKTWNIARWSFIDQCLAGNI